MVNRHVRHERIETGRIDLMQNFSFFEVPERQADVVQRALSHAHVNGQHVVVEPAGEEGRPPLTPPKEGDFKPRGKKESSRKRERDEQADSFAQFEKKNKRETKNSESSKVTPPWEGQGGGHRRPSREERGYTSKRGPMKKDDWKQFFQQDERPLRGAEPDFSEEGWARRKPKKK
jgi:ATP-dependent RNA helicase DeaD